MMQPRKMLIRFAFLMWSASEVVAWDFWYSSIQPSPSFQATQYGEMTQYTNSSVL